jgi:membrane protein YdbS with pleckstrin-like domain
MSNLEFNMKNSQRRIVNLWLFLMAVFMFCIFLPSIIGLDGFDGGFAMSFTAGFMVIMSLVVIFIYRSRAKQLDKILKGEGRIAVWRYSQDEWVRFIAADFEDEKKSKKLLFIIVAVIAVVVGILLMISLKDPLALLIALGIIPIVAIPAFLAPRARFNKLKNSEPKALISEKGVIVGRMFHLWVSLGASLDEVILSKDENPEMIEFTYSMPTRNGRDVQVARLPVPKGKHYDAEKIIAHFNSQQ